MWFQRILVLFCLAYSCWSCTDQPAPNLDSEERISSSADTIDYWQPVLDSVQALYAADQLEAAIDTANHYFDNVATSAWLPTPSLGMLWHRLGVFHYLLDEYDEAGLCFRTAIGVRELVRGHTTSEVGMSYHNLGVVYKEKGNYLDAISALEKAARIRKAIKENDRLGRTYQELAIVSNSQGDYDNALIAHQAALPLLTEAYGSDHRHTARSYFNMATLHRKLGQYKQALTSLEEARRIYTMLYGEEHAELASCFNNFGNIYDDQSDYASALQAYRQSLAINQKIEGEESMEVAENYNNLGFTYYQLGALEQARYYQDKSLTIRQQLLGAYHPRIANSYHNLAEVSAAAGEMEQALIYHQQALHNKFTNFRDSDLTSLPNWDVHTVAGSHIELLEILFAKARTWQKCFEQSDDVTDLAAALSTYKSCDQLIDRMRREYTSDESVLFLLSQTVPIYEGALEVVFALQAATPEVDQTEQAFHFMEKSKSVLLLSSLKENQARMAANIPQNLLAKENAMRVDLAYQQRKLAERELEWGVGDSIAQKHGLQLLEQRQKYREFIARLEADYPTYVQKKYNTEVVPLETFRQDLIDRNQAFVEYFVGERQWFVLALSADGRRFERVIDPDGVAALVKDCLEGIGGPDEGPRMFKQYAKTASDLHEKLWSPVADVLKPRTLIATAGVLGYLPFEALLSQPLGEGTSDEPAYLIQNHQLSYAYSATVYEENYRPQLKTPTESVLALAPGFANDSTWVPLQFSEEEARKVKRLIGGDVLLGNAATKAEFQRLAPSYRVLHISSHAAADSSGLGSWIAFGGDEEQQLFLPELYAMDLAAELAVLSACETGLGEVSGGEGVMSLARGFAYAGCQSVITTLWKVNHRATTQIMGGLYEQLATGATKDAALRQAQLDYLQDPSLDQAGRHPYYWSAFRQIGNAASIQVSRPFAYWWLLGGVLLLLIMWGVKRQF
ncbi:MAG: CHAT domain-containing tetratricopeptide repeat protein [Bacteroidota bacterium]